MLGPGHATRRERDDIQGELEDLEVNGIGTDGTLDHVA
jgi:hypothetical protein